MDIFVLSIFDQSAKNELFFHVVLITKPVIGKERDDLILTFNCVGKGNPFLLYLHVIINILISLSIFI